MMGAFERVRDGRETVRASYAHPKNFLLSGLFFCRPGIDSPLPSGVVGGGA